LHAGVYIARVKGRYRVSQTRKILNQARYSRIDA
jgi:hypothetical protein